MFFKPRLKDIYKEYMNYEEYMGCKGHVYKEYPIGRNCFDRIPPGKQVYKKKIIEMFKKAVGEKNEIILRFCIAAASCDGFDADYTELFNDIILERWHSQHEDIIDIIHFDFPNDIFTEAIFEIAMDADGYRWYDDELEATLRKCIYALKAINTLKANIAIEELIKTGNPNVGYSLEMYK